MQNCFLPLFLSLLFGQNCGGLSLGLDKLLVVFYMYFLFFLFDVATVLYDVIDILVYIEIHF